MSADTETTIEAPPPTPPPRKASRLVLVIGVVSALLGISILVATLTDYILRAAIPARSWGGIGVMLFSLLATVHPFYLMICWRQLQEKTRGQRLAWSILPPVLLLACIAGCMLLGLKSQTPVLPLATTPVISFEFQDDATPYIDVAPDAASNGGIVRASNETLLEFVATIGYVPGSVWPLRPWVLALGQRPTQRFVVMKGSAEGDARDFVLTIDLTLNERTRFKITGRDDLVLKVDGEVVSEGETVRAGAYTLVIVSADSLNVER